MAGVLPFWGTGVGVGEGGEAPGHGRRWVRIIARIVVLFVPGGDL